VILADMKSDGDRQHGPFEWRAALAANAAKVGRGVTSTSTT